MSGGEGGRGGGVVFAPSHLGTGKFVNDMTGQVHACTLPCCHYTQRSAKSVALHNVTSE